MFGSQQNLFPLLLSRTDEFHFEVKFIGDDKLKQEQITSQVTVSRSRTQKPESGREIQRINLSNVYTIYESNTPIEKKTNKGKHDYKPPVR